jgi:hypothetical protein
MTSTAAAIIGSTVLVIIYLVIAYEMEHNR